MDRFKLLGCGLLAAAGSYSASIATPPPAPTAARHRGLLAFLRVRPGGRRRAAAALPPSSARGPVYTVTATAYEAVAGQTDDEPFVTADNSHIPVNYSSRTRWLALSRDLLHPWGGPFEYGDRVRVRGVSHALDGVYTVHDTMHQRHRHCLDVLVHPREHVDIYQKGVRIQLAAL